MPSKKNAVNSILGVSDGSSTFAERERSRGSSDSGEGEKSVEAEHHDEQKVSQEPTKEDSPEDKIQQGVPSSQEQPEKKRTTSKKSAPKRRAGSTSDQHVPTSTVSELRLDTSIEQTAKASYYLSPEQTKRLDDLRTAFRHEANYAPRDASYSRIVGLAIDRLYEEVFQS